MSGVITAINAQSKNRSRMNIFIDARYRLSLNEKLALDLKVGQVISEEEILRLEEQDVEEQSFQRALRLISHRPRSVKELETYFDRREIPPNIQARLIDRLKAERLVDDAEFARTWVENRMYFRPRSSKMLRYELRQKGIHSDEIDAALADFDEQEAVMRTAEKGARRWRNVEKDVFQKKLVGYLRRRGFSYSDIQVAVDQLWLETAAGKGESEVNT